jgi:hypothetical protein
MYVLTSVAKCYIEYVDTNPFKDNNEKFARPAVLNILIAGMIMRIVLNLFMMCYAIITTRYFIAMKI